MAVEEASQVLVAVPGVGALASPQDPCLRGSEYSVRIVGSKSLSRPRHNRRSTIPFGVGVAVVNVQIFIQTPSTHHKDT